MSDDPREATAGDDDSGRRCTDAARRGAALLPYLLLGAASLTGLLVGYATGRSDADVAMQELDKTTAMLVQTTAMLKKTTASLNECNALVRTGNDDYRRYDIELRECGAILRQCSEGKAR